MTRSVQTPMALASTVGTGDGGDSAAPILAQVALLEYRRPCAIGAYFSHVRKTLETRRIEAERKKCAGGMFGWNKKQLRQRFGYYFLWECLLGIGLRDPTPQ